MKKNSVILMLVVWLAMLPIKAQTNKTKSHPNIVLIMADDVGWECFGSYGAQDYKTPNIDSLAKKGVQFNNCFSTPICSPSRVKIMTGKYNFRNYTHFGYLNPKEKTFGHLMQEAGYKTAIAGKWQLNGLYHNAVGCTDNKRPQKAGFDEYCLWQVSIPVVKKGDESTERFWSPTLEQNGEILNAEKNKGKYGPDIMSDFVCDFIKKNKDVPFFIYYPTVLVHAPFVPTPENIANGNTGRDGNANPKDNEVQKQNFIAMVDYLDKIVGKIHRQLEEVGLLDNTIILFTADNGTSKKITSNWNGQKIKGGKGTTTNLGTHVPLIAYWKGHTPKGVVLDNLIDFTDFYPTLSEAAGAAANSSSPVDGISFLPSLKGEKGKIRNWQLCHYQPYWDDIEGSQYLRNKEYKLYSDSSFYYIPNDLKEENNLKNTGGNTEMENNRKNLSTIMKTLPPPPPLVGSDKATTRPTHPLWRNIVNPND